MDNKEYKDNNYRGPVRGPGPRHAGGEKAKDLVGTWKKLLSYCRKYLAVIVLTMVCAVIGTVLTLIGPDKLSEMTDTITSGISPDEAVLNEISDSISANISANMQTVISEITNNFSNEAEISKNAAAIIASDEFSEEDKQMLASVLMKISEASDADESRKEIFSLPGNILNELFASITVNNSEISGKDQAEALTALSAIEKEDGSSIQTALSNLPDTVINAIYTDISVNNVIITGKEQLEMSELMAGIDENDTSSALNAIESLPDSVYSLVKPSIDMDKIMLIAITLIVMYAISFILTIVQHWSMSTVTQRVTKMMRTDISKKINTLPMWFYNKTSTGDVLSRVTNDVDTIGQSLNQSINTLVSAVVLFFGSLLMMLLTDGWMTLTAVVASLLGFILMFAIMGKSQKYFARQQKHLGRLNGHIEEIYSGHTVVKAYNGEKNAEKTFDEMNGQLRESGFRAQCLAGLMQPIMGFIGNLGYVAVCVVGGAMALDGRISFGVIVAFMMYVRYFTQPLSQMAQAMQSLQSAAAAGERVFEFLEAEDMEDESEKTVRIEKAEGLVEFKNVRFGYEDSDNIIIHDFSAIAKPGQKIAIVGPTGAGKTTMVNLLMRFHEIQGGEILIDGVSTKELTRENVHEQFCMVLQETWLFEGTVRENLVYCADNVSEDKIVDACKAVGLDHFIRTLPNGYDTVLNDQINLSQGQKQQLTIARAMIADKPMLILDEATSSVDTRTELQIQSAMDKLMESRTSFVIAHRLSTIKNADLILVMKNGDIIESGNHEELLAANGFYADLYNSQFEQAS